MLCKDSFDYTLRIPHKTDDELGKIINDIMQKAHYIADLKNGFAEMIVIDPVAKNHGNYYESYTVSHIKIDLKLAQVAFLQQLFLRI